MKIRANPHTSRGTSVPNYAILNLSKNSLCSLHSRALAAGCKIVTAMRGTYVYFYIGAIHAQFFITMYGTHFWFCDEFTLLYHDIKYAAELSRFIYPTYTSLQRFAPWLHSNRIQKHLVAWVEIVSSALLASRTWAYLLREKRRDVP